MNQRQIMERNLALILQQQHTESHHKIRQPQLQPVNPFEKRVFDKKFKKSTIFSENVDPNAISRREQHLQYSHYLQQVSEIIAPARKLLDDIESSVTQNIKMSFNPQNNLNAQIILYNLKKSIRTFEEDFNQCMNEQKNIKQYQKDETNRYCESQVHSTEKYKPAQYFKNHQNSLNLYNSRNSMESSQAHKDIAIKNSYYISQKNSTFNMQSQQNSRVKMSIYEMVLQQRKKKQHHKKKKMI